MDENRREWLGGFPFLRTEDSAVDKNKYDKDFSTLFDQALATKRRRQRNESIGAALAGAVIALGFFALIAFLVWVFVA